MKLNVIDTVRELTGPEFGEDARVELSVGQLRQLLGVLTDQEREILGIERRFDGLRLKITALVEGLDCYDFSQYTPEEENDGDVFEVFIGTISEHGRIFAIWDASSNAFHEPPGEGGEIFYLDNVIYWRYSLPEPHEAVDLSIDD